MSTDMPAFRRWIDDRYGVAHTSDARAAGFRPALIAAAVAQGVVDRERRSWLVSPGCDGARRRAAAVSGRVTCVSAAALRGLWMPHDPPTELHVAVAHNASRMDTDGLHLHWGRGPAPVSRNSVDDHILNVLFHTAHCLGRHDALPLWSSAASQGLVDAGQLTRVAWRNDEARQLARATRALSDSGTETIFVDGMAAVGVMVRQQVWIDGHPLDGLIGERLAIQIDGFAHHQAAQRRRDLEADARLVLQGYTVLRFDYRQIVFEWPMVLETVLAAIAQGLHLAH